MIRFLASRLLQSVFVLLVVGAIAFSLTALGDPVSGILGTDAPPLARAQLRAEMLLDRPLPVRYVHYIWGALHGDLGLSYAAQRPVTAVVAERLPATIELGLVATLLSLGAGIGCGVFAAVRPYSRLGQGLMGGSLLAMSVPTFVLGILLITLFAVELGWLPSFGRGPTRLVGDWPTGLLTTGGWAAVILPAATLAVQQSALVMRLVRAEMADILRANFIRFARARGLPGHLVYLRHALRNTLVPVITITGLQVGSLLSFAIVTEAVFQWPGVGLLFMQALQQTDTPVIAGLLMLIGQFYVVVNLVVDLLHASIDPRLRAY